MIYPIEFSITGFTNPADSTPFEISITTTIEISGTTYEVEKFVFDTMAVTPNT